MILLSELSRRRIRSMSGVSRPPSPNLTYAQYTSPYSRPPTPPHASSSHKSPQQSPRFVQEPPARSFSPHDVMVALIEEDMERLRARRRAGTHQRHHHSQPTGLGSMGSPAGSTFSGDSGVTPGLGTGAGLRDVLPLKSRFYDWCCEYFKEPQMRVRSHV